jgi:hypothetical protein
MAICFWKEHQYLLISKKISGQPLSLQKTEPTIASYFRLFSISIERFLGGFALFCFSGETKKNQRTTQKNTTKTTTITNKQQPTAHNTNKNVRTTPLKSLESNVFK